MSRIRLRHRPGARPRRRPRPPGRGPRRRAARLPRPGAVGRPRHAPGRRRPRRHLGGVHLAEPGLRAARQPLEPPLRLRHHRDHLARHRLRAAARRDRPVGRLHVGPRLGDPRRALDQPRLAGGRRHPRGARARRRRGRALRGALQPRGDALLRGDAGGSAGAARAPALPARLHGLDQPALRSAARALRAEPLHAERAVLRAGADPRGGCALDRDPRAGATAGGGAYRRRDERPRGQGAGAHGRAGGGRGLPRPGAGRAVDVRALRAPRRGDGLRLHADQVGPIGDGRGRQPRGRAPRGHQRAPHLHVGVRPLLDVRGAGRRAFRRASRLRFAAGGLGRRQPQRHRGGGDRRHRASSAAGAAPIRRCSASSSSRPSPTASRCSTCPRSCAT